MSELFRQVNLSYNLRTKTKFLISQFQKTFRYGTETLYYLGPIIWNLVPPEIKNSDTSLHKK